MKTIRFSRVVERSGRPQLHTFWRPPEQDPEFKRAQRDHRVMTLSPTGSGDTHVGSVGFEPDRTKVKEFLVFPRSLKRFAGRRIVGIKYDLFEQPKLRSAKLPARAKSRPAVVPKKSGSSSPVRQSTRRRAEVPRRETPARDQPKTPRIPKAVTPSARAIQAAMQAIARGNKRAALRQLEDALAAANRQDGPPPRKEALA
jgi:hypothetical protein